MSGWLVVGIFLSFPVPTVVAQAGPGSSAGTSLCSGIAEILNDTGLWKSTKFDHFGVVVQRDHE